MKGTGNGGSVDRRTVELFGLFGLRSVSRLTQTGGALTVRKKREGEKYFSLLFSSLMSYLV